jgi:ATP-binding cassette, subfamily F, member 3
MYAAGASLMIEHDLHCQGNCILKCVICCHVGDVDLIDGIDWSVMPGERYAVVGPNGAGKSTLLAAIAGQKGLTQGKVLVKQGIRLGYLVQKGVSGSTRTVYEEASSQMDAINSAAAAVAAAMAAVEAAPADDDSTALNALLRAQTTFEAVGGPTQRKTVAQVLGGLGFSTADESRSCSEFSGGWRMRIALARLLLSDCQLLLLDEPVSTVILKQHQQLL